MEFSKNELLRAMEGEYPEPDTIAAAGQSVLEEAEPDRLPGTDDHRLTPYNKAALILQLLAMDMTPKDLVVFLEKHAMDLEIYQLAPSGEEIRDTAAHLNLPGGNLFPLLMSVAADMAINANHSAGLAYEAALRTKHEAEEAIWRTYGDAAISGLRNALEEIRMVAKDMTTTEEIYRVVENAITRLPTTSGVANTMPAAPTQSDPAQELFGFGKKKQLDPEEAAKLDLEDLCEVSVDEVLYAAEQAVKNFKLEGVVIKQERASVIVDAVSARKNIVAVTVKVAEPDDAMIIIGAMKKAIRDDGDDNLREFSDKCGAHFEVKQTGGIITAIIVF